MIRSKGRNCALAVVFAAISVLAATTAAQAPGAAPPLVTPPLPEWAYPKNPPVSPFDATTPKQMPGSDKKFTQAQVEDDFNPPDWFPGDHPAMPPAVAIGRAPDVKACSKCHVPTGGGHPESSDLAGLPVAYMQRQMADFKNGNRKGGRAISMLPIARAVDGCGNPRGRAVLLRPQTA